MVSVWRSVIASNVTERRRWRPPYQTGKTVHVHAKHNKHNEDGGTAPGVCGNGSVPLSHSGNVVTRIGIHTHIVISDLSQEMATLIIRSCTIHVVFTYTCLFIRE